MSIIDYVDILSSQVNFTNSCNTPPQSSPYKGEEVAAATPSPYQGEGWGEVFCYIDLFVKSWQNKGRKRFITITRRRPPQADYGVAKKGRSILYLSVPMCRDGMYAL